MRIQDLEERWRGHVPMPQNVTGRYAVLVPLVERDGEAHLLFEVRASHMSRQPGEVCFPGGGMEPGETPLACALRETEEELGIPPCAVRPIAELDFLIHQSGYVLYPVLGRVDGRALEGLRPNPDEVGETFLAPAAHFARSRPIVYSYELVPDVKADFPYEAIGFPQGYRWRRGRVDVPIYRWEGRAIWGITGNIIRRLVDS